MEIIKRNPNPKEEEFVVRGGKRFL